MEKRNFGMKRNFGAKSFGMKKSVAAICVAMLMTGACLTQASAQTVPVPVQAPVSTAAPIQAVAIQAAAGKITVDGQGTIKVLPDIATVTLGVTTSDSDAKRAQDKNSSTMSAVIAAMKAQGVADKDITTAYYYLNPDYNYSGDKNPTLSGYTVSNSVTVTLRDVNATGKILDAGISAGANNANSITFSLADSSAYYSQALQMAVKNAKVKAGAIAAALGVTIGNPVEVTENVNGGYPAPVYSTMNARPDAAMGAAAAAPIQANEILITADVSCVFNY